MFESGMYPCLFNKKLTNPLISSWILDGECFECFICSDYWLLSSVFGWPTGSEQKNASDRYAYFIRCKSVVELFRLVHYYLLMNIFFSVWHGVTAEDIRYTDNLFLVLQLLSTSRLRLQNYQRSFMNIFLLIEYVI